MVRILYYVGSCMRTDESVGHGNLEMLAIASQASQFKAAFLETLAHPSLGVDGKQSCIGKNWAAPFDNQTVHETGLHVQVPDLYLHRGYYNVRTSFVL